MNPVTLSEPAYAVGQLVPVEQVAGHGLLFSRLRRHGFDTCSVAGRPPSQLAAEAVSALLRRSRPGGGGVDAVVYGTCSHRSEPPGDGRVRGMLDRLGLAAAGLYGVWLGESGNLAGAVRLARALLAGSAARTVLLVVTDAVADRPGEYRAMPNAVTVNGDGAAACLLSTADVGPFTLEGVGHRASAVMSAPGRATGLKEYLEYMAGVRASLTALYDDVGAGPEAYRWLVANNYSTANLGDFAELARIPHDRVFSGTASRHGHVFTADALITLLRSPPRPGSPPGIGC